MLIGMIGLLGWIFDIETFKQFLHHGIAIKANTAIALLLAGLSLCLFILDQQHKWSQRVGQVCAALVLIVGVLSLSEHTVDWNLGIDQILFHEPPGPPGSLSPGRPGPPASLCFILGGIALLLLHERSKKYHTLLQILAIGIGLIAAPGLIGYAYGAESLYGIAKSTAIAFHTALALGVLAAGILFAYPTEGIASLVYDKGIGGSIARRLLPPAILVPLVLGWFRLRGEEQGYYVAAFGTAVMMLIMITLLSSLVLRAASVSRLSERQQLLAEEALLTANQELEQRVAERTGESRAAFRYARSLLEASLDPLVTISPEGKVTDVNKATELATGVSRERLIGSNFSDYFTEPHKANEGYLKVLAEGLVRDYPLTIRHVSGSTMDVLYNATVYKNEAGETQGVFAAARDITERKRAEQALRAASLYARGLLEASLDPLVTISHEGNITDVNQATELATGVARNDLIGSVFSSYFTEPQQADEGYRKVISEGFVRDYPLTIRHASGRTMDVLYNAAIYKNEAGQVQGVFAAARDITERKRAEEELNHYREHLEELVTQRTEELSRSNRDLEQFAYAASHDLQEPLRMISGYLQLLSERYKGQLDEKADKYIDYSVDGAARMSILIRDLLDYSRVNTRGEELRNVDCNKAFESALRNLGSAIKESGANVTHDSLPVLSADQTQLAQLFQNLVGNAIKFRSPQRPPQIHVSARKDQSHWLFRVEDNGIGFEQQYEDKIFMIFQRLHGRGQYPGTGIGLAICKRIIERHGGRIWAASEPDKGTNFFFTIPI
ncbi:MAG: PAS domain S-box protein [Thermoguttaceae bacterium]